MDDWTDGGGKAEPESGCSLNSLECPNLLHDDGHFYRSRTAFSQLGFRTLDIVFSFLGPWSSGSLQCSHGCFDYLNLSAFFDDGDQALCVGNHDYFGDFIHSCPIGMISSIFCFLGPSSAGALHSTRFGFGFLDLRVFFEERSRLLLKEALWCWLQLTLPVAGSVPQRFDAVD